MVERFGSEKYAKISRMSRGIKGLAESTLALLLIKTFGLMPRGFAHRSARILSRFGFHLATRLRRAGFENLRMTFPELSEAQREQILRGCFQNLGRLLVEFTH